MENVSADDLIHPRLMCCGKHSLEERSIHKYVTFKPNQELLLLPVVTSVIRNGVPQYQHPQPQYPRQYDDAQQRSEGFQKCALLPLRAEIRNVIYEDDC